VIPLPETVAGRRAAWVLDRLGIEGWIGAPEPAESAAEAFVEEGASRQRELASLLDGCRVTGATGDDLRCDLVLHAGPLRRSTLRIDVEARAPHRIERAHVARTLPEGMELRAARDEDGRELAELCRQTPIVLGDRRLVIDPGDDYWTATRLMDGSTAIVATYEGRIVAVQLATMFEARFDGKHQHVAIVLHVRVHPDFAMAGVRSAIQRQMMSGVSTESGEAPDGPAGPQLDLTGISYVSSENELALTPRTRQASWACKAERVVLPCPLPGTPGRGRVATPADAAMIVGIINAGHRDEELFLDYTEEKLQGRLTRAADLYGWDDVLVGDGAVVGTWFAGQRRTWHLADGTTSSSRALVADYGALPGREDELVGLLATAAARAASLGMTELAIFSSKGSRGYDALRAVAADVEQYEVVNPFHPEPAGTVERGIWVDQLHF
jgi:hypothetical protein